MSIAWAFPATLFDGLPSAQLRRSLVRTAYFAQHEAVRWPLIALNRLLFGRVLGSERRKLSPNEFEQLVRAVRRRYRQLQHQDLRNVGSGIYPASMLFAAPIGDYARATPHFACDVFRVVRRARQKHHSDLPKSAAELDLPAYYRRCFHWQTDGYLSQHSAKLYDLGVEILFTGVADVMRRQVLAPLARLPRGSRILDVGCGTGRLLWQLARAQPGARLTGVDLSEAYLNHARQRLDPRRVELVSGNAERLPFADDSFDAVVSVFMFHELPRHVRRTVFGELCRVLAPGGTLVIQDSAQLHDSPELAPLLEQFPRDLHEPFFSDYVADPLEALFEGHDLEIEGVEPVFVAKLLCARARTAA